MMKKVLFLYYSQTGQTERAMQTLAKGFSEVHPCDVATYTVDEEFRFPWKMRSFFRAFPRCVLGLHPELKTLPVKLEEYDLIFVGGQVWFLSPSLPLQAFLNSPRASGLQGKNVISVVTCRNLYYGASELIRTAFKALGANFFGQITLCEKSPLWASFVTTPRWMLTGKKGAFAFFPEAGISEKEFLTLEATGRELATGWLQSQGQAVPTGILKSNLDRLSLRLMDRIGRRFFIFWSALIGNIAPNAGVWQDFCLVLFRINLIALIVVITPCTKVAEVLLNRRFHIPQN